MFNPVHYERMTDLVIADNSRGTAFPYGPINMRTEEVYDDLNPRNRPPTVFNRLPVLADPIGGLRHVIIHNHRAIHRGRMPRLNITAIRVSNITKAGSSGLRPLGLGVSSNLRNNFQFQEAQRTELRFGSNIRLTLRVNQFFAHIERGNDNALSRCHLVNMAAKIYSRVYINDFNNNAIFYVIFSSAYHHITRFMSHVDWNNNNNRQVFFRVKMKRSGRIRTNEIYYIALKIAEMVKGFHEKYAIQIDMRWDVTHVTINQWLYNHGGRFNPFIYGGPNQQTIDRIWNNSPDICLRSQYKRLYAWIREKGMKLTSPTTNKNCFATAMICSMREMSYEESNRASLRSAASRMMKNTFGIDKNYHLNELIDGFSKKPPSSKYRIKVLNTALETICEFGPASGIERFIFISVGHTLGLVPGRHILAHEEVKLIKPTTHRAPGFEFSIGFWDMETTTALSPYMIAVKLEGGAINVFTGTNCVTLFSMFLFNVDAHEELVIYAHNGGKFDVPIVLNYFRKSPFWKIINFLEHSSRILSMTILALSKRGGKCRRVVFRDTYPLMSSSLSNLCKLYNVEHGKISGTNHDIITDETWEEEVVSQEIVRYIRYDVLSLEECLTAFRNITMKQIGFDPVRRKILTSPGISRTVFMERFYSLEQPLYNLTDEQDAFCRRGYYGGRCEVFNRVITSEEVFHYDINSLYPSVMVESDLPYGVPIWRNFRDGLLPDNFFGFLKIKVIGGNDEFNVIRVKTIDRGLITPTFTEETEVVIFSEELRFVLRNIERLNYRIKCIGGYAFQKAKYLKEVTEMFYEMKQEAKATGNIIGYAAAKVRLNSIYGHFGLKKKKTAVMMIDNGREFNMMVASGSVIESDGKFVIASVQQTGKLQYVPTAAAITAYSHVKLCEWLLYCIDNGKLFYCDTDCAITTVRPEVIERRESIGTILGHLDFEEPNQITGCVLLGPKLYAYKTEEREHLRSKGVPIGPFISKEITEKAVICTGYRQYGSKEWLRYDDFIEIFNGATLIIKSRRFVGGKRRILSSSIGLEVTEHSMDITGEYRKGRVGADGRITPLRGYISGDIEFFT